MRSYYRYVMFSVIIFGLFACFYSLVFAPKSAPHPGSNWNYRKNRERSRQHQQILKAQAKRIRGNHISNLTITHVPSTDTEFVGEDFTSETIGGFQASNIGGSNESCFEQRHVIYVRIPKTGSSTMTFLMWRFGMNRNLKFLLPKKGYEGSQSRLVSEKFYLPKFGKFCDLMAAHVFYNYHNYQPYFRADTVYISLLREPLSQLFSTIYYIGSIERQIPGANKVSSYLRRPSAYEPRQGRSFTHNPLASFLGLQSRDFFNKDQIINLIYEIENRFSLFLILEKLNESLVLLKRKLCWSTKDILYIVKNINKRKPKLLFTEADSTKLKRWSTADYAIYEHFYNKLDKLIKNEGLDFQVEVEGFERDLKKTKNFCQPNMTPNRLITFEATSFSEEFTLTSEDCRQMTLPGGQMLPEIIEKQRKSNFCG